MNQPPPPRPWYDALTWACVYGGLLSIVVSLVLDENDAELAVWFASAGSLATALGIGMIYIQSRKK